VYVKKRRDHDAVREALRAGGFTPGLRDVDAVVAGLADPDEDIAREAERALARLGDAVLPSLTKRAGDERPAVRAGVMRVAGRIAPRSETAAGWIISGLQDSDARVKRHAAIALGKLRDSEAARAIEDALLAAWDRGPAPDLERAIAASLGKLGSTRAVERLRAGQMRDPETSRVAGRASLMVARDLARKAPSAIDAERILPQPVRIALLCRGGLERIVAEEARDCPGVALVEPPIAGMGRVLVRLEGKLGNLFRIRTSTTFAAALLPVPLGESPEDAFARALSTEEAKTLLHGWTVGVVRYRIAWAGGGHHRARTWRAAQALTKLCPTWVNDPTESTWEARAREEGGSLWVELHPRGLEDPRFTYRVRDVPAASHPPLAAALVRVAGPLPDDVVWDPFMGSGVELVERALAGPYARLEGSDIDPRALDAARANFAAAGVKDIALALADATVHSPGPGKRTTLIVTNPPMGRRVARDGTLGSLLERFVDHAADVLPAGGRLVWLSPLGAETTGRAAARGFAVTMDSEVDMGGFRARLQRFVRSK
jgi:predicted RNA methylase